MKNKQNIALIGSIVFSLFLIILIWATSGVANTKEAATEAVMIAESASVPESSSVPEATTAKERETIKETMENTMENTSEAATFSGNILALYELLQNNEVIPYTLNEKASAFLNEHGNLFPTNSMDAIDANLINYQLTSKQITKNDSKYGDELMFIMDLGVHQIMETEISDGEYFTELNVSDVSGQQYYILYNGELDNIFEGDSIFACGLPLGNSSFENLTGGQTLSIVLAGSYIEKHEDWSNYSFGENLDWISEYEYDDNDYDDDDGDYYDEWDYYTEDGISYYILPYSDSYYYTEAYLSSLTNEELRLARNEIYARHGRLFDTEDLNAHFSSMPWYFGYLSLSEFDDSVLNEYEKANIEAIKAVEAQR